MKVSPSGMIEFYGVPVGATIGRPLGSCGSAKVQLLSLPPTSSFGAVRSCCRARRPRRALCRHCHSGRPQVAPTGAAISLVPPCRGLLSEAKLGVGAKSNFIVLSIKSQTCSNPPGSLRSPPPTERACPFPTRGDEVAHHLCRARRPRRAACRHCHSGRPQVAPTGAAKKSKSVPEGDTSIQHSALSIQHSTPRFYPSTAASSTCPMLWRKIRSAVRS